MNILVIGGTVFLSRTVVEVAIAAGHSVSTFSRGLAGPPVPGARPIFGDRANAADLQQLLGRKFDLVFDTGYFPDEVRAVAELLDAAAHYAFVSSVNAFSGWPEDLDYRARGTYEGDPDAVGSELPAGIDESMAYGWRKAGAERAVVRAFSDSKSTVLRAGLIVGPQDGIGRMPWWIDRIAKGGRTLMPGVPSDPMRVIDAHVGRRSAGTFEVTGPAGQIERGTFFDTIRRVTHSDAEFVWVDDAWLASQNVTAWTEIPLWLPASEAPSTFANDTRAAEAAGLTTRPVIESIADTWAWMQSIEGGWTAAARTPGLSFDREVELLDAWARKS